MKNCCVCVLVCSEHEMEDIGKIKVEDLLSFCCSVDTCHFNMIC